MEKDVKTLKNMISPSEHGAKRPFPSKNTKQTPFKAYVFW